MPDTSTNTSVTQSSAWLFERLIVLSTMLSTRGRAHAATIDNQGRELEVRTPRYMYSTARLRAYCVRNGRTYGWHSCFHRDDQVAVGFQASHVRIVSYHRHLIPSRFQHLQYEKRVRSVRQGERMRVVSSLMSRCEALSFVAIASSIVEKSTVFGRNSCRTKGGDVMHSRKMSWTSE